MLCLFPQPQFDRSVVSYVTGGFKPVLEVRHDAGFYAFECGGLDAPNYVASGGMDTTQCGGMVWPMHQAYRFELGVSA